MAIGKKTGKKLTLPLFSELLPPRGASSEGPDGQKGPTTIDVARRNLGGRARTNRDAGSVVSLVGKEGVGVIGVVLFASDKEIDVWISDGIVRRTAPSEATPFAGAIPEELERLAADARLFAGLSEGQRVRYEATKGVLSEGGIVEKCRYGALVLRADGKVLAVGFRKLWPVSVEITTPN